MKVTIDLGRLQDVTRRAIAELDTVPAILRSAADLGAAYARTNHEYQNRTGLLEKNTVVKTLRVSSGEARVELGMYRFYAAYVRGRGLTSIDDAANRTRLALQDAFSRLGR